MRVPRSWVGLHTPSSIKLPSGKLTVCYWKLPFIVDLPMKHCDFPTLCKRLPEGNFPWAQTVINHHFFLLGITNDYYIPKNIQKPWLMTSKTPQLGATCAFVRSPLRLELSVGVLPFLSSEGPFTGHRWYPRGSYPYQVPHGTTVPEPDPQHWGEQKHFLGKCWKQDLALTCSINLY